MAGTPLVKDLIDLVISKKSDLGIPSTVRMDRLMGTGDSLSVAMHGLPKTLKEYINGSKVQQASFDVMVVTDESEGNSGANLEAVGWLDSVASLFESMDEYRLSDDRVVRAATQVTLPTIVSRTDTGRVSYVLTIAIEYREE